MNIQPQGNLINPALTNKESYIVFGLSGNFYLDNSSLTINDLLNTQEVNGSTEIYWDFETIDKKLQGENFLNLGGSVTPILLGYNLKDKWHLNFNISLKNNGYVKFPGTIGQVHYGNVNLDNNEPRTIDLDNYGINVLSYVEYSFGISKEVKNNFNVGMHVKLLTGIAAIKTNGFLASIETSDDFYESTLTTSIVMEMSGPLFESDKLSNVFQQQLGLGEFLFGKESSSLKNFGAALDLGFNWDFNDKWNMHGSITDLGAIRWKKNPQRLVSKGEYVFDAVQFTPYNLTDEDFSFKDYLQQYADTVLSTIIPTTFEGDFKTALYTKSYLGLNYQLSNKLKLSGLYNSIIYKDVTLRRASLGTSFSFNNSFALSSSISYSNFWFYNIGLGIHYQKKRMQVYLVTDNINIIDARNSKGFNCAFGVNYWLRGKGD